LLSIKVLFEKAGQYVGQTAPYVPSYGKKESLYKNICGTCHGEKGLMTKNLARLAGQRAE
jgi:hypothetical protein